MDYGRYCVQYGTYGPVLLQGVARAPTLPHYAILNGSRYYEFEEAANAEANIYRK